MSAVREEETNYVQKNFYENENKVFKKWREQVIKISAKEV